MDFDFSEEQTLLKESVAGLLAKNYTFEKRKAYGQSEQGYSQEMWNAFAEQGLLGLPFSEEDGGFGGGAVETMIVMEQLGRHLCLEPYFASVILAGGLLKHAGSSAEKAKYLPSLIDGSAVYAFAFTERQSRHDVSNISTQAAKSGDNYTISGDKCIVLAGDYAHRFIVTAKNAGHLALFVVEGNAKGVTRRGYDTQDGLRGAEISFENTPAVLLKQDALPAIQAVIDEAIAALAAEATGAFDVMLALTVEYMKTRKQFGVVISQFQALQHKASEMFVSSELARSMAYFGAAMLSEEASERSRALSQVKVQIGRSAKFIGQGAIQLHGGVGMTHEYAISHYFKRVTMIDTLFGDADEHLGLVAA
jgi:pimeloyl-CoA dehydrogenase small subunit